ncbi:MAG: hypothetical protein ACON49_06920 [Candidatus Puniceispirillaceae bacterium]
MRFYLQSLVIIFAFMTAQPAYAQCGFLEFSCHQAKEKAEKTQAVIAIIKAGRDSGWTDVRKQFTRKEIAKMRTMGLNPSNVGLLHSLKDVNDDSFADLDEDTFEMVVEMISSPEYVEKAIAKNKLGVDVLERKQRRLSEAQKRAEEGSEAVSDNDYAKIAEMSDDERAKLIDEISKGRTELLDQVDNLDSGIELTVLTGAIASSARTLDQAGVEIAQSLIGGQDFDSLVERAATNAGVSADFARETLQEAVSFGVSELAAESLARTDAIGEAGNQAAAVGDYAAAAANDASARAQAAADRAAEAAALKAAGLTEEAAKVAEIAEAEAELAAEAAQEAAQIAAQDAANAAAQAEIAAQNAAITAQAAADSAAQKADFISQALADGATQEEAAQLAADAGY